VRESVFVRKGEKGRERGCVLVRKGEKGRERERMEMKSCFNFTLVSLIARFFIVLSGAETHKTFYGRNLLMLVIS
jgi:hypothetical protein